MIDKLLKHLNKSFPFLHQKRLLLAVSGGVDSMVMTALFHKLGYDISIAHCNFNLRKDESASDQQFVNDHATTLSIPYYTTSFDTAAFASDYKLSTQMAARKLRYKWFEELAAEHSFDYILTAHQADDTIETFLINLSRGTGIAGLTGIPPVNGNIIRPLLNFSRDEIVSYAMSEQISWTEDSSNRSDGYLRNNIRHNIVPLLKQLNPQFIDSFTNTIRNLNQSRQMADDASLLVYKQVVSESDNSIRIQLDKLMPLPNASAYLFHWLQPFGFTAWDDIYALTGAQSGKQVFSERYSVLKNRDTLIMSKRSTDIDYEDWVVEEGKQFVNVPLKLSFTKVAVANKPSNKIIFVDKDKLNYPLTIRRWQAGDCFSPNGMGGKTKKVSKLLKDEKQSLREKEHTWLLLSGPDIVWVIGLRQDERFAATVTSQNILQISLLQ